MSKAVPDVSLSEVCLPTGHLRKALNSLDLCAIELEFPNGCSLVKGEEVSIRREVPRSSLWLEGLDRRFLGNQFSPSWADR